MPEDVTTSTAALAAVRPTLQAYTPDFLAHLRNMTAVTEMGGIVFPPVPAFYARPSSIEDMVDHTVGRLLDLFDIEHQDLVRRWEGLQRPTFAV